MHTGVSGSTSTGISGTVIVIVHNSDFLIVARFTMTYFAVLHAYRAEAFDFGLHADFSFCPTTGISSIADIALQVFTL